MIAVEYNGRFGNQVIQYILSKFLANKFNQEHVSLNFSYGDFLNIKSQRVHHGTHFDKIYTEHDLIEFNTNYNNVLFRNFFGMNPKNFEVVTDEEAKKIIKIPSKDHTFEEGDVICGIRGGDILDGRNSEYGLIPAEFYISIIKKYKFNRIFIAGELNHQLTIQIANEIKKSFENSVILPMADVYTDFINFYNCPNIIGGYSSFHWIAAFLSNKTYAIFPKGKLMDKLYYNKFIFN